MRTLDLSGVGILVLSVSVLFVGCGEKKAAPEPEPAKTEAQLKQEAQAARQRQETAALEERASRLREAAAALRQSTLAGAHDLPGALEAGLQQAEAKAAEVDTLASALRQANGNAWDGTRAALEAALGEFDQAHDAASKAAADWKTRTAQALAARESGSPIDSETGLILGLDGGQYEQYLVSVVEKVQTRLRRMGLYAGPADGTFDTPTLEAVGAFQAEQSLPTSGVPSPITRGRLFSDEA